MKSLLVSFDDFRKVKKLVVEKEKFLFVYDKELVKSADLCCSFEADKYDNVVNIIGKIFGTMFFECSRCLKLFEQEVKFPFECSFTKEEFECDVANEMRETVIINIPMQPLCSKDCKGLCSVCGSDKNKKNCLCEQKKKNKFVAEKWSKIVKFKI